MPSGGVVYHGEGRTRYGLSMALDIQQRDREGIAILDLKGRLTVGQAASGIRDTVRQLADEGRKGVIFNLADVDFIDSSGLGSMVICFTTMQKAGGTLRLLHLTRRNIELLVLTKLTTVFEVFTDEQDAVNSFFPGREIKRFDILSFVQQQEQENKA